MLCHHCLHLVYVDLLCLHFHKISELVSMTKNLNSYNRAVVFFLFCGRKRILSYCRDDNDMVGIQRDILQRSIHLNAQSCHWEILQ